MPTWKASLFLCKTVRSVKCLDASHAGSAFKKRQSESIQSLSKTGKLRPDGRRSPGRTWWLWRRRCLFLTTLIFFAYFFISRWKSKARPARTKESKMSVQTHRNHSNTLYSFRPITQYLFLQHSTADGFTGMHPNPRANARGYWYSAPSALLVSAKRISAKL